MDLLKINLFRGGFFKQAKFLFTSPKRAQKVFMVSETGVLSLEVLPMSFGFVSYVGAKLAWLVFHPLKLRMRDEDDPVLPVSERSYYPLDAFGKLKSEDKDNLLSLKQIAKIRHAERRTQVGEENKTSAKANFYKTVVTACFVLIAVIILIALIK